MGDTRRPDNSSTVGLNRATFILPRWTILLSSPGIESLTIGTAKFRHAIPIGPNSHRANFVKPSHKAPRIHGYSQWLSTPEAHETTTGHIIPALYGRQYDILCRGNYIQAPCAGFAQDFIYLQRIIKR